MIKGCRFISFLLVVMSLLFMVSCGEEEEYSASYEKPAFTMGMAIVNGDTRAYLNCFTDCAKEEYINSKSYTPNLAENIVSTDSNNIKVKTKSDEAMEQEEVEELEQQYKEKYKKRIEIDKARKITATFTLSGEKAKVASQEMTVVKVGHKWLVYGEVIEKIKFK